MKAVYGVRVEAVNKINWAAAEISTGKCLLKHSVTHGAAPQPLNPEFCAHWSCSMVDALGLHELMGSTPSAPICAQRQGLARARARSLG
ncbi:hypothetical protein MTO96_025336 [Rhipicephalus appendiculatus]